MKMVFSFALMLWVGPVVSGQPAFTNLNFESAVLIPQSGDPYYRVQFAAAFPGWTAYVGGVPQNLALYNN